MDQELAEKAVIQTLAYFDLFEHPLTVEEVLKYLWNFYFKSNVELRILLSKLVDKGEIGFKDGYYFLLGKEENVVTRQRRIKLNEEKLKISVRGIKKLRYIPFIRAVFVCNTLSIGAAEDDSDIDVFVIAKKGRIWLARLLTTVLLQIFGLRRTKKKIKNQICLSFYLADSNLNLSPIALSEPDIYLIYWLEWLIPIFDSSNLRADLLKANSWSKKYLPQGFADYSLLSRLKVVDNKFSCYWRWFWEKAWQGSYGNMLENQARQIQMTKMRFRRSEFNSPDKGVVVNDGMLKFHENDRREYYKKKWEEGYNKFKF